MATVLVVDDEPTIVDLLIEFIEDLGHTAIAATNGVDALALAQQHQPSLIISDVRMPIMDGYALLAALRADPVLAHTMVILISAHLANPPATLGTTTAFVPKPLDLHAIEGFLQRLP